MATDIPADEETAECPACERPVRASELREWSGTCRFCKKSFARVHGHWAAGKSKHDTDTKPSTSPLVFEENHHQTSVGFNFDAIDQTIEDFAALPTDARAQASEALCRLFGFIFEPRTIRACMARFVGAFSGIRPDLLRDRTGAQLGAEIGVTKQSLSKAMTKAQGFLGVKFGRTRDLAARKNMAASQLGHPDYSRGPARKPGPKQLSTTKSEIHSGQ